MVNITDVKQILQFAIDAEIKVFLDGGWGVDALLGYQSRAHNDIDIFVEKNDYQNFIEIMKANGFYEIKMEYTTLNHTCLLYTSPSPRDGLLSRMPSSA